MRITPACCVLERDKMAILTVLIGAGASFDCADGTLHVRGEWQPPLVNDLFRNRPETFAQILKAYPGAQVLAAEIRDALDHTDTNYKMSLEAYLKRAMTDETPLMRKHYREVPLYLQHLLTEVSTQYVVSGVTKFHPLVTAIARSIGRKYERVLFLTLNYDLFLDNSLSAVYRHPFSDMPSYISRNDWSLIKLHGSITWMKPLYDLSNSGHQSQLDALWKREEEPYDINAAIEVVAEPRDRIQSGRFMYPVLAVPIEGKSGFVVRTIT